MLLFFFSCSEEGRRNSVHFSVNASDEFHIEIRMFDCAVENNNNIKAPIISNSKKKKKHSDLQSRK